MILQNSSAIKTAKILSVARGGVCYRAGGSGAGDLRGRGERVQYAVLRVDDVHVLPARGDGDGLQHCLYRALRYPPRLYFPRRRSSGLSVNGRTAVRPVLSAYQQREALVVVMIVMMVVVAMGMISIVNNASR